jgi:hypothetical protein
MTASLDEEAPAMESMRWVGVDVHAKESWPLCWSRRPERSARSESLAIQGKQ